LHPSRRRVQRSLADAVAVLVVLVPRAAQVHRLIAAGVVRPDRPEDVLFLELLRAARQRRLRDHAALLPSPRLPEPLLPARRLAHARPAVPGGMDTGASPPAPHLRQPRALRPRGHLPDAPLLYTAPAGLRSA